MPDAYIDPRGWAFIEERTADLVSRVTSEVLDDAKRMVPVDTGELRASLHKTHPEPLVGHVVAGTDHWDYVEFGTENMDAQPYLRPALYRRRLGGA